jgi:hypothetical protein
VTRKEQLTYFEAERRRLLEDWRRLYESFEDLRSADFPADQRETHDSQMEEYLALLANHRIAWEWTRYPSRGRITASASSSE